MSNKSRSTAKSAKPASEKTPAVPIDKEQTNFRNSKEFVALVKNMAQRINFSEADTLRLSVFLLQKNLDRFVSDPTHLDLALMSREVPEAEKFRALLERRPRAETEHGIELVRVLRDFYVMLKIADLDLRLQALESLEKKLLSVFERVRAQARLNRENNTEDTLRTELDLI